MVEQLEQGRALILPRLEELMTRFGDELTGVNPWGADVCRRVLDYSSRGKLIRGSLVIAAAEVFGADLDPAPAGRRGSSGADAAVAAQPPPAVVDAACAMELLQSFLLIHDDIMDDDDTRRGAPSVHAQYRDHAGEWGVRPVGTAGAAGATGDAASRQQREAEGHAMFGRSMGICAGDVTLLLAQRILAALDVDAEVYRRLNSLVAREIAYVGVAQMNDLYFGYLPGGAAGGAATEDAVYNLYRYKTGRYTFSLPLAMGAIFAGLPAGGIDRLMTYGEEVGVVFQIVDDDIGLFGETAATGKPVGSDISADKKTLHRRYLLEALAAEDDSLRERIAGYFGDSALERTGVEEVRELFLSLGVRDRIDAILDDHAGRARSVAAEIVETFVAGDARRRARQFLDGIVDYNVARRV